MGLDWNFVRITPEQYTRLLSDPTLDTVEAIHNERFKERLQYVHSPGDGDPPPISFDGIYHLGLRTDWDELDTLMTFEEDDGPVLMWPLGNSGVKMPSLGEMTHLLNPEEVLLLAPTLQLLLDKYLDQRYRSMTEDLGEEATELEELYPELRECFNDLTGFVQTAAKNGEAILWDLS